MRSAYRSISDMSPSLTKTSCESDIRSLTLLCGMASALVRLYKDEELRRRLVENGSRTVQQYSISGIVEKHVSLYKRIVTERNAGP